MCLSDRSCGCFWAAIWRRKLDALGRRSGRCLVDTPDGVVYFAVRGAVSGSRVRCESAACEWGRGHWLVSFGGVVVVQPDTCRGIGSRLPRFTLSVLNKECLPPELPPVVGLFLCLDCISLTIEERNRSTPY